MKKSAAVQFGVITSPATYARLRRCLQVLTGHLTSCNVHSVLHVDGSRVRAAGGGEAVAAGCSTSQQPGAAGAAAGRAAGSRQAFASAGGRGGLAVRLCWRCSSSACGTWRQPKHSQQASAAGRGGPAVRLWRRCSSSACGASRSMAGKPAQLGREGLCEAWADMAWRQCCTAAQEVWLCIMDRLDGQCSTEVAWLCTRRAAAAAQEMA